MYCQAKLLWKCAERAGRGQCQPTVRTNDWDIRTTTFLGLTCLWVSVLAKKKSEMVKKKQKKTACTAWGTLAVFAMLSSFPGLPTKSFLKSILHSNENDETKFQFRFALNARSSSAFGQRTSVDQLAQLSAAPMTGFFSWRDLKQRALEVHCFSSGMQRRDAFHFVFKRRYRYTVRSHMLGEIHKRMFLPNLRFFCSCCRTSCVSVQPCTLKVLPIRKRFCILAYFSWHVLYLHYVR